MPAKRADFLRVRNLDSNDVVIFFSLQINNYLHREKRRVQNKFQQALKKQVWMILNYNLDPFNPYIVHFELVSVNFELLFLCVIGETEKVNT